MYIYKLYLLSDPIGGREVVPTEDASRYQEPPCLNEKVDTINKEQKWEL